MAQLTCSYIIKYMFMKKINSQRTKLHELFITHFYKSGQMNLTANYVKLSISTRVYITSFPGFFKVKVDLQFCIFIKGFFSFQETTIHPPFL